MRTRGIDISQCQGTIDFDKLPDWVRYVFVKTSEGWNGKDPNRARNLAEARRRGLYPLVYHFSHLDADAHAQIENLWSAIGDTMPLMIALDFEYLAQGLTPQKTVDNLRAEAAEVEENFGRPGDIYTFPWFATSMGTALSSATDLARCGLWMADYSGGETPPDSWHPVTPKPWGPGEWRFAQTSGNNSSIVPGIPGHVDHDIFNGDEQALRVHLGLVPPLPPTVPDLAA